MDASPDAKITTLAVTTAVFGGLLFLIIAGGIAFFIYWTCKVNKTKTKAIYSTSAPPSPLQGLMDLTLVVTDIESSTGLWELLDAEAMNKTLGQHHSLIRKLLKTFGGQEVATEGDSFILSFSNPQNALDFSLDLQSQLMDLDYVDEVLKHPICEPVSGDINQ